MLELVIAVVVAFVVGLLIGVSSMNTKVKDFERRVDDLVMQIDTLNDRVYEDVYFQITLLRCGPMMWQHKLTNEQRKRLRRLGSQLLRIKDTDEDHPDSVERQ